MTFGAILRSSLTCLLLLGAGFAHAAEGPSPESPGRGAPPAGDATGVAPDDAEPGAKGHAAAVDALLGQLAKADDPRLARRIAGAIQAIWARSGSDTIDLLTTRAQEAQRARKIDVAIKLMDEVVSLRPDYADGWNRRALLHYQSRAYDEAMIDLKETLTLEPRNYIAWLSLGRILKESDLDAKALAAFRKALALYPQIEGLKREVDELALKVEGQPI